MLFSDKILKNNNVYLQGKNMDYKIWKQKLNQKMCYGNTLKVC